MYEEEFDEATFMEDFEAFMNESDQGYSIQARTNTWPNPTDPEYNPLTNYPDHAFDSMYRIKDVYTITSLEKCTPENKQYILKSLISKYGAAAVNMYASGNDGRDGIANYYHAFPDGTCSFNSGSDKDENGKTLLDDNGDTLHGSNHCVTLVGWDDNYPVENFEKQPSKPGAWIMKNSWGTEIGTGGYTYISYEDAIFANEATVFVTDTTEGYDNNYFHSNLSCGAEETVKGTDFVEIYEIQKEEELINAISFNKETDILICGYHSSKYGDTKINDVQMGCSFVYTTYKFDCNSEVPVTSRWVDLTNITKIDWLIDYQKGIYVQNPDGSWATFVKDFSGNLRINLLTDDLSTCQAILKDQYGNTIAVKKLENGSILTDLDNTKSYTTMENGVEVPFDFSKPITEDIVIYVY